MANVSRQIPVRAAAHLAAGQKIVTRADLDGPSLCAIDPDYCEKHADCAYNKVWHGADRLLNDYFSQITLRDLFERGAKHPAIVEAMGHAAPTVETRGAATLEAVVEGEPLLAKESCA